MFKLSGSWNPNLNLRSEQWKQRIDPRLHWLLSKVLVWITRVALRIIDTHFNNIWKIFRELNGKTRLKIEAETVHVFILINFKLVTFESDLEKVRNLTVCVRLLVHLLLSSNDRPHSAVAKTDPPKWVLLPVHAELSSSVVMSLQTGLYHKNEP